MIFPPRTSVGQIELRDVGRKCDMYGGEVRCMGDFGGET
jgi:hypothetical protein